MAEAEKTVKTFPVVPTAHWWELRRKFQKSIPGVVTAQYIASVLNMQEGSARANVLTGLRLAGIVNKDGKPTDLAARWRDDGQYADVCDEILNKVYPAELRHAFPEPAADRAGVARWFAHQTKGGEAVVEKFVKFYLLLNEADASKATGPVAKTVIKATDRPKTTAPKKLAPPSPPVKSPAANGGSHDGGKHNSTSHSAGPAVHINLQVHISADASADQIEQVFASMAKHIYPRAIE